MKIGNYELERYMTLKFDFPGIRVLEGLLNPVIWSMEIEVVAIENSSRSKRDIQEKSGLVYQKIHFWLETCLPGCVFVNTQNELGMEISTISENIMMHCPDEPTDDVLIQLIHSKLSVIADGYLVIGKIRLQSNDTSAMYTFNVSKEGYSLPSKVKDYIDLPSLYRKPWWQRNDGFVFELLKPKGCKDKLTELYAEIHDPLKEFEETMGSGLGFEEFEEPAELIQVEKWRPRTV